MHKFLIATLLLLLTGCPDAAVDADGDGWTVQQGDCNDNERDIHPQVGDVCNGIDDDCDGAVDFGLDRDDDGVFGFNAGLCPSGADCDDFDATVFPGADELCDAIDHDCDGEVANGLEPRDAWTDQDGDGFGAGEVVTWCEPGELPEGLVLVEHDEDCDDDDPSAHPGAAEECDDIDHDCDGVALPAEGEEPYRVDGDGDGFGAGDIVLMCVTEAPDGYASASVDVDCDDEEPAVSPAAEELCNGIDDDCDGLFADEVDTDGDGQLACAECDDDNAAVHVGAIEACDGLDNSCAGALDPLELDGDGDGYLPCSGFVDVGLGHLGAGDCDDSSPAVSPAATEACNGLDDDCDGGADEGFDSDGDGVLACGPDLLAGTPDDDCDDTLASVFPGAPEACNGLDDDCDAAVPADEADDDGDGHLACAECDDGAASVFPGAPEVCDGQLNNCLGFFQSSELDADGDGFVRCGSFVDAGIGLLGGEDCADGEPARFPGAPEACDGLDSDCDGVVPADEADGDGDGFRACADCDDGAAFVFPDAPELCDGQVNACGGELPADEADPDGDGYLACAGFVDRGLGLLGGGDCAVDDDAVHPGAIEACNGVDDDCNGLVPSSEEDDDGDGFAGCAECDDHRASVFPGAPEACDGVDSDCDGARAFDEIDLDLDGWLPCTGFVDVLVSWADGGGDCDDDDPTLNPGVEELCDGEDDNCDGVVDEGFDVDGDSVSTCAGDCDDGDAGNFPGNAERCDLLDNNCDGVADEGFDTDGDAVFTCGADGLPGNSDDDCDDTNADVFPGADEVCNGVDDDCDALADGLDDGYLGDDADADGDPAPDCGGADCDDFDPAVETLDVDGDGSTTCAGDCADLDPYAHPAATEACDGADTDCDGLVDGDDPDLVADADGDGADASGCSLGGSDCDDRDPHVFAESSYTSGLQPDCAPAVYPGFSHEWHHARISLPSYFVDPDTGLHYIYYRGHHQQELQAIGVSSSVDGQTWTANPEPVLGPNPGQWDHQNVSNPTVVKVAGALRPYVMLYHARPESGAVREIGLASATDPLGPFERLDPMSGAAVGDPVLPASADPSFGDSGRTLHPAARYDADSGLVHVWYNGRTAASSALRIFHATSDDAGMTWDRTDEDGTPGPDPILEAVDAWEGNKVSQPSWIEKPDGSGEFEFWFTGNGNGVGKAEGTATDWVRVGDAPVLTASADCARQDGDAVSARGVHHDPATDTYHWLYGGQSDLGAGCADNADPIYANGGETVSYVARASNPAPAVSAEIDGQSGGDVDLGGTVTDTAPDLVIVTVESDVDGFLGTADLTPTGNSDPGVQTTSWALSATGLSPGAHDLFVDAVDEAGTVRTATLSVVVP